MSDFPVIQPKRRYSIGQGTAERMEQLERDLSFLAQMMFLSSQGHAVAPEYKRLREIADRYKRFNKPDATNAPLSEAAGTWNPPVRQSDTDE